MNRFEELKETLKNSKWIPYAGIAAVISFFFDPLIMLLMLLLGVIAILLTIISKRQKR